MEKDIESLRNKKIQEMEELLEIKNKKERSRNELEELRLDVYREKNLLDSLRHQRAAQETSLEHLRKVEAVKAAVSVSSAGANLHWPGRLIQCLLVAVRDNPDLHDGHCYVSGSTSGYGH